MAEKAKGYGYQLAGEPRSMTAAGSTSSTVASSAAAILRDPRTNEDQKIVALWVLKRYPERGKYKELLEAVPDPKPPPIR